MGTERKRSSVYEYLFRNNTTDNNGRPTRFAIKSTNETNELFISERGEYFSTFVPVRLPVLLADIRRDMAIRIFESKTGNLANVINRKGKKSSLPAGLFKSERERENIIGIKVGHNLPFHSRLAFFS